MEHKGICKFKKSIYRIAQLLIIISIIYLAISTFFNLFFGIAKVTSCSMSPTFSEGDYLLIDKRISIDKPISSIAMFLLDKFDYCTTSRFSSINRQDILVFIKPEVLNANETEKSDVLFIKRCIGLPDDTLLVSNKTVFVNSMKTRFYNCTPNGESNQDKSPNDSISNIVWKQLFNSNLIKCEALIFPNKNVFNWSLDSFGPIWIPSKGVEITLTPDNIELYSNIIIDECENIEKKNNQLFLNDHLLTKYSFKLNYYFMIGDNYFNSFDSRYWGFLPEKNIIGRVKLNVKQINLNLNKH